MKYFILFLFLPAVSFSQFSQQEISRYQLQAKNVTVIRDTWGIPHIYGKTDADAVFGLLFAQCEDDFKRVEFNNLENLGRMSEATGEKDLFTDLQMRLIYDSTAAIKDYNKSPLWFKKLLDAAADGVNYYLYKHPEVKPAVLTYFKPWYQLMRTNGSISATNTAGVTVTDTRKFYSGKTITDSIPEDGSALIKREMADEVGSNGFAVAPSRTASKNAILYINPHVTFYFRSEVHMVSDEGLNAYGAVTWGQFFVFQGFNQHCGWMHTSSDADLADLYEEKIQKKKGQFFYTYNNELRPVSSKHITIAYKTNNNIARETFTTFFTHHGPVIAGNNRTWLSLRENNRSLEGLMQSWLRTKAKGFEAFEKVMQMRSNTSDNTVFADDKGNIAYWHGNFIPRRDTAYDWSKPVDGSTSATEWKGIHSLNEIVHVCNPSTGWIQNCNSTPFTVSGKSSPDKNKYPVYMAPDAENLRAINATRLFSKQDNFTLDKMIATGYNTHLSAFDILLPSLFIAYEENQRLEAPIKVNLDEAIQLLKLWNREASTSSVATTLAIEWASRLLLAPPTAEEKKDPVLRFENLSRNISGKQKLNYLQDVINYLNNFYGNWRLPWGEINRYQRTSADLNQQFDDNKPSFASGLASSEWGCIPSFKSVRVEGAKKRYGVGGNSFVAAVEFGKRVKAKTIVTGGEGMDPSSKHFLDQAEGYLTGKFKDVWFYKEDVLKHIERKYHPGE